MTDLPDEDEFRRDARAWLRQAAGPFAADGHGDDSVAVFENWTDDQERAATERIRAWERTKFDAGWGALTWPARYGGRGLPVRYEHLFLAEERQVDAPRPTELFAVSQRLVPPTIQAWGTDAQRDEWIRALLRTDRMACQLFSEPAAGSDLAGVTTSAVRDGDDWILSGQKVWTSGARVADLGEAICRSDPAASKHAGLTAFLVPMDAPGVTVRPIHQMTGGSSFNEVFLDEVRVPDAMRLGPQGAGWKVALTTLAAERADSGELGAGTVDRVLDLARQRTLDDIDVDLVADLVVRATLQRLTARRVAASLQAGMEPGPEGSVGKLFAAETMRRTSDVVAHLLGADLTTDTGDGSFAWTEQVLGAPGYRIAGGTDQIQRTIIAERVLGLPRETR